MKFRRSKISRRRLFTGAFTTLFALVLLTIGRESNPTDFFGQQLAAAQHMRACLDSLGTAKTTVFASAKTEMDPNGTGLIGVEYSPMTTTLGSLIAKRTSTNPDFAALLVRWFHHLDAREGDIIAIGCSGSFPALALAALCAAEAMQLKPVIITSLGSSSFGANRPEWTYLDMETVLYEMGMIHHRSSAASLGGDRDAGLDLTVEGRQLLVEAVHRSQIPLIYQPIPAENVIKRAEIYWMYGRPEFFVNIGGAQINIGDYASAHRLSVGPNRLQQFSTAPPESMGAYFAGLGIPIVHLLQIEHAALDYGLTIDPHPLPEPGLSPVYYTVRIAPPIWIFAAICILASWLPFIRQRRHPKSRASPTL